MCLELAFSAIFHYSECKVSLLTALSRLFMVFKSVFNDLRTAKDTGLHHSATNRIPWPISTHFSHAVSSDGHLRQIVNKVAHETANAVREKSDYYHGLHVIAASSVIINCLLSSSPYSFSSHRHRPITAAAATKYTRSSATGQRPPLPSAITRLDARWLGSKFAWFFFNLQSGQRRT